MNDLDLAAEGPGAPPRSNGELVFDAPWQSRAFGVAAALAEAGCIDWSRFQAVLIERVGRADTEQLDTGRPSVYWQCWLDAMGSLVEGADMIGPGVWSARSRELAGRAPGHDH